MTAQRQFICRIHDLVSYPPHWKKKSRCFDQKIKVFWHVISICEVQKFDLCVKFAKSSFHQKGIYSIIWSQRVNLYWKPVCFSGWSVFLVIFTGE